MKNKKGHGFIYKIVMPAFTLAFAAPNAFAASPAATVETPRASAQDVLDIPDSALLSPTGGRLTISREAAVKNENGASYIEFVLPGDAMHPQIEAKGNTIVRWGSTPIILEPTSLFSRNRENALREKTNLSSQLATVNARLAVWQATPESDGGDMTRRQSLMESNMPALFRDKELLERKLALVQGELAGIPASPRIGQLVRVELAQKLAEGHKVPLDYSYEFGGCGWHPIYSFNAMPDRGEGDVIDTHLLAEVWQYSGIDWKGTKITLASRGSGPREPAPLKEWTIDSVAKPVPTAKNAKAPVAGARGRPMVMSAEVMDLAAAPSQAPVESHTEDIYATWQLSAAGLPEGRTRLEIMADAWKAPLQWLARPTRGDSRVWLYAKYKLPVNQSWPAGTAEYSVNYQNVGEGMFMPRSGEATLYFGPDPRVNVRTVTNSAKHGETGFITASKTWSWAWTYIISNEHGKEIVVRVERPEPVVADENITVTYEDKPAARKNEKEHMLYWEEKVPAHGTASIQHGVQISSPIKIPLLPDVP